MNKQNKYIFIIVGSSTKMELKDRDHSPTLLIMQNGWASLNVLILFLIIDFTFYVCMSTHIVFTY